MELHECSVCEASVHLTRSPRDPRNAWGSRGHPVGIPRGPEGPPRTALTRLLREQMPCRVGALAMGEPWHAYTGGVPDGPQSHYVITYVCTHIFLYICIYIYIYIYIRKQKYTHLYINICIYAYLYMYSAYISMNKYVYI